MDDLVLNNMKLVYYIIKKYYPAYIGNEDFKQEGMLGLVKAASTWDETKSKFTTYACICILNHLRNFVRYEYKHYNVASLNNTFNDGECDIEYLETILGDSDVNIKLMDYARFYETLNKDEQHLVDLCIVHTEREIAPMLGIAQRTVNHRKQNIRKKWRKYNGNSVN